MRRKKESETPEPVMIQNFRGKKKIQNHKNSVKKQRTFASSLRLFFARLMRVRFDQTTSGDSVNFIRGQKKEK